MRATLSLIALLLFPVLCLGQSTDPLFAAAVKAHGGDAVFTVTALTIRGQSSQGGGKPQPVVISASLLDNRIRLDYGQPIYRTDVSKPEGGFSEVNGVTTWRAAHAGAYAQLDWFSILGARHLAVSVEQAVLADSSISGRATSVAKVATGRQQIQYRRQIKDEAEVQFDKETGLVAAISRRQTADQSLDLTFILTTTFSDYRPVAGMALPYQIRRFVDGRLVETIAVDSIEINPAFERYFFGRY